jgi:hypothetical protein
MTIERELLVRAKVLIECLDTSILQDQADIILSEIKKLLAQPEQEPVAWKETIIEHFQSAFDSEMYRTDEGEELILLEDAICYVEEFAPPKRELLGDGITADMYRANKKATHPDSYWAGVYDAEKAHGIGVDDEN